MTQDPPPAAGRPRVRYYAAQSLDGYIAETDHTLAWLLDHDERTAPADPSAGAVPIEGEIERFMDGIGAVVVGARTYEWVLAEGAGWPYPGRPTWVLSHRDLPVPEGADVRVGALSAADATRAALDAAGDRDVWVLGGGPVAQDLAEAGLLDTVEVTVVPVVLGSGVPLFSGRLAEPFVLTGVTAYANGMVHLAYRLGSSPPAPPRPAQGGRHGDRAGGPGPPMTAEQLQELTDEGLRHELVEGVLATMVPAGGQHGRTGAHLLVAIANHVRSEQLGEVFTAGTGFVLRRDPDTVRAPDVAFVRSERVADGLVPGFPELAPDLVAEVVSPSDRAVEVTAKARAWLEAGVRLVWVVDPSNRLVTVHRQDGTTVLRDDDLLSGEDVLPGLQLDLTDLWA